jgi:aspartate/methionine/tyrosine aminotransferase
MIALVNDLDPDEIFAYPPTLGTSRLRKRWFDHLREANPSLADKQISLPVITSGITHGLSIAADLFCDEGDVVILPDKMWGNYRMIFGLRRKATIQTYPFFLPPNSFNIEGLRALLRGIPSERKTIIIFNFPNNPTGYTLTCQEADELEDLLLEEAESGRKMVILADDAYFGFFYEEGILRESLFSRFANLHPHILALKVDGATKECYAWGLRVGFFTIGVGGEGDRSTLYDALEKKVGGAIRSSISCCSTLSQNLILKTINSANYQQERERNFEILKSRYLRVKEVLENPKFRDVWRPYPFNSGYFMCLELKEIDADRIRRRLLDKYGVGVIATDNRDLRIAFSCVEQEQMQGLFQLVYNAVREHLG